MSKSLRTAAACNLLNLLRPHAQVGLVAANKKQFGQSQEALAPLRNMMTDPKASAIGACEDYLNDLFVLQKYIDFLSKYAVLWEQIVNQKFSDSWASLQDALDLLRLIKRFSQINIEYFENQLTALEKTYPYNVFFSVAIAVENFDCSVCGKDIDSVACPHRRGHLYAGVMAHAIARKVVQVDHIALVTHPEDKRCVVKFDDNGEQFKLVRLLSTLISSDKFRILDFGRLEFSKRKRSNPDYVRLGRNELCYCGSGKKFKNCCIAKDQIEGDHVDLVAEHRSVEDALP